MKQYSHAWLAYMAIKRLEDANLSGKYYCENNAVFILDPKSKNNRSLSNRQIIGHIITDPMVFVEKFQDLEFARAIHEQLIKP